MAPMAWSLADACTVPDIAWPRLIYDGDDLAGCRGVRRRIPIP